MGAAQVPRKPGGAAWLFFLAWFAPGACLAAEAGLVLLGGRIWTASEPRPWVQALAIQGSRIVAAGSDDEIDAWIRPGTRIFDLHGRLVVPGFNDAHIHFLGGALGLREADLVGACSVEAMQRRVVEYARTRLGEAWITGSGWEYACFPKDRIARKEDLDAVVKDRPVYLRAYDGHSAWVNSRALRVAGITGDTVFQAFGEVVKDPRTGEPTGWLKEGAEMLVRRLAPRPTRSQQLAALEEGMRRAAALGMTSIQVAGSDLNELSLYEDLVKQDKLTLRVAVAFSSGKAAQTDIDSWAGLKQKYNGPLLRAGAVKFMIDGVIESHTAAMIEPYADKAASRGSSSWEYVDYRDAVARADRAGLQVYTHAIGDRAVRMALDAYEHALALNGAHDARFRIEHIETIHPGDVARFARLGVIASMQPIHADPGTMGVWSAAVGSARLPFAFAWRGLEKAGARLVYSSDWPACISLNPFRGLHVAVNRRTVDGRPPGGWIPQQRVSLETALRAYTTGGAYASFEEHAKGKLVPGMLADLIVLSQDLFRIDAMKIHETKVLLTVFDGRVVHQDLPSRAP